MLISGLKLFSRPLDGHISMIKRLSCYFGLLKIADTTIRNRLVARGWSEQLIIDNINWAHFLEDEVEKQESHFIVLCDQISPKGVGAQLASWIVSTR